METNTCIKCRSTKPIEDFVWRADRNKYRNICKSCANVHTSQYVKHRRNTDNKFVEHTRNYHNAYDRRPENRAKQRAYQRAYQKTPKHREWLNQYRRERLQSDPLFALISRTRNRIRSGLKSKRGYKTNSTVQLIGCSFAFLKEWLGIITAQQLKTHEIDHICPLSQARTQEEVEKLCHYTNLKLIDKHTNRVKSDSRTPEGESLCQQLLGRPWIEPTLPQQGLDFPQSSCYNI